MRTRGSFLRRSIGTKLGFALSLLASAVWIVGCISGGPNPPPPPPDDGPKDSAGELVLVSPTNSFPIFIENVVFEVQGASLTNDPADVLVLRNGILVPHVVVQLSGNTLTLVSPLLPSRNDLQVFASDSLGLALAAEVTIWAGDAALTVEVVDTLGAPVADAEVTVALADDQEASAVSEAPAGLAEFLVPARTVIITATAPGGLSGSAAVLGNSGFAEVVVSAIGEPSPIDNNNFSLGTDGWELDADGDGLTPVSIIGHVPESLAALGPAGAIGGAIAAAPPTRRAAHDGMESLLEPVRPASDGSNADLMVTTAGMGSQGVRRTFTLEPGTKNVMVRFRFITTEVPGGYFGSQYNDAFTVRVRSQTGAEIVMDSNSMNGLGLGAFDPGGVTAWTETTLPVSVEGDVVEVDISVTNVGDGFLDSSVVVELVRESNIAITQLRLNDIDNQRLERLSVSPHTFFSGNTRIYGTIKIEGPPEEKLTQLRLELLQGGTVVATATLANSVSGTLLAPFGADRKVEVTTSQLLFELASSAMSGISTDQNGSLVLRVKAIAENGTTVTYEAGSVQKLVLYGGTNRYGTRNDNEGGDGWAKPEVIEAIDHFSSTYSADGFLWGDFSNMNGGTISPHSTHKTGNDMDGFYTGYLDLNAAAANQMIKYLNDDDYGSQIQLVFVSFTKVDTNTFWNAIKEVTLDDGRLARLVIQPKSGHGTHFHWTLKDD